ncbi:MAG TPA: glycosyltransferase family 1 protein [Anaerolineales bacterium]
MSGNVAINARCLAHPTTGVERYAYEVAVRLGAGTRQLAPGIIPQHVGRRSALPRRAASGLAGHLWEQVVLPRKLRPGELLWSPANTGPLAVSSQVMTLHDLSVIDHPEWFRPNFATWYAYLLPRLAWRVRRVITDSQFSRDRILSALDLPPDRVNVIYPGVDRKKFWPQPAGQVDRVRARYGLPARYVLCVATHEPRKNLPRLLQAWQRAQAGGRAAAQAGLVIAGGLGTVFRRPGLGARPELKGAGYKSTGSGVRWLGYVPDEDLPALYSGALVFALPSLYEGFGLPVLEAMACGTPVVTACGTGLPEAAGEAGLLVDPLNVDEIAATLSKLLADEALRSELAGRGLRRAESCSFEQTAREVWNVLQQCEI